MSLLDTAPAGADSTAAPATPAAQPPAGPRDERAGAAAIEALLDWQEQNPDAESDDTESEAEEADDAGTEETPSTGDEEGHSEPQDGDKPAAAIEPPASWSAEDKALFAQLPPEAQAVMARRESERDKLVQQRTQEIADTRKAIEAERAAIDGQRKQYLESLQVMLHTAVPEAKLFAEITDAQWQQLSTQNPAEYVRLRAARDALGERIGKVQAEMQRVSQEAAETQQKRLAEHLVKQRELLAAALPDFADPVKGKQLASDLSDWLKGQGFSPEEIAQAADHRLIKLAVKAMRADQAEAARKAAEAKRANPAPRVQQPNAAPQADDSRNRRIEAQHQRLRRTGSVRDAAALIENFL